MTRAELLQYFEANRGDFFARWKKFLSFASISTDPAHDKDCSACAEWVAKELQSIGLKTEIFPTSSKPVVFAEYNAGNAAPTVLYYGHYDVQPADPLELWSSKPFEPTERGGRLYARGAQDNKGQTSFFIAAVETLIRQNKLNCTVKIILEGEEECGSEGLTEIVKSLSSRIKASTLLVSDSEMHKPGVAAVTMGFRGIVHLNVFLRGSKSDLHSGLHGGVAPNPATQLARLIATLHDEKGRVAVNGFYDGIPEITSAIKELVATRAFDPKAYEADIGVPPVGGEEGVSALEREGLRPTIEVNGLHAGYGGPGGKTIVPSFAEVKLSCRTVQGQEPEKILAAVENHIRAHAPKGLKLEITDQGFSGPALVLDANSPLVERARRVIREALGTEPVFSWSGGSIPVLTKVIASAGAEPLLVGFGLSQDRIHAPDESFSFDQFRDGYLYSCLILEELSSSPQ